jgi:hypothetical protein
MLSHKEETELLEKFLNEIGLVRMFALDAIKEAVKDANVDLVSAKQSSEWDKCWAEVGLAGSFVAIVGTVIAASPAGVAALTARTILVASADAWVTRGAMTGATGGLMNLVGGYEQNLKKPSDSRQGILDSMKQSIIGAIDTAREQTLNHLDDFAELRDRLYKKFRNDAKYNDAFSTSEDPNMKRHSSRIELIWTALFRGATAAKVKNNQCTAEVKKIALSAMRDLFEVLLGEILPEFLKPAASHMVTTGVGRSQIARLVTDPEPDRSFNAFLIFMHGSPAYKGWMVRHKILLSQVSM